MSAQQPVTIEIFYVFALEDSQFGQNLEKHLDIIQQKYNIIYWHPDKTPAGQERNQQIDIHIKTAHIILLLISSDFLSSSYLQPIVQQAMTRRETENVQVIPILIRPALLLDTVDFHKLQFLPIDKIPITLWANLDEAYVHITKELSKVIEQAIITASLQLTQAQPDQVQPTQAEHAIVIYLQSIEEKASYKDAAHYNLKWKKHFVLEGHIGGHQLKDPTQWNTVLQKKLYSLKDKINASTDCRLLRVYGASRLCCWFAFGFVFRETSGFIIEQNQQTQYWRTDTLASKDFAVKINSDNGPDGETLTEEADTVAIGISVRDTLDDDVRRYIATCQEKVAALLLIHPERELGLGCIQNAGDAIALANSVRNYARELIKRRKAKKLLLFYTGPATGACFIGYKLNALDAPIQIMEYQNLEKVYIPTFLLS